MEGRKGSKTKRKKGKKRSGLEKLNVHKRRPECSAKSRPEPLNLIKVSYLSVPLQAGLGHCFNLMGVKGELSNNCASWGLAFITLHGKLSWLLLRTSKPTLAYVLFYRCVSLAEPLFLPPRPCSFLLAGISLPPIFDPYATRPLPALMESSWAKL